MSTVTTATILVDSLGGVTDEMLTEDRFMGGGNGRIPQGFRKFDDEALDQAGGSKWMECDGLYAAAFNYVPGHEIAEWFRALPWGDHGSAYLVWECNGETYGSESVGWTDLDWRGERRPDPEEFPFTTPATSDASMFIQWKGTNVCLDFCCPCGAHGHLDADFAYHVKCPACGQVYEMGTQVIARKVDGDDHPSIQVLDVDEMERLDG